MAEIKLTPEELLSQSMEFSSLQSEYEALFTQVTTALNGMNESWSENLAHNFTGKISSAQKKFSSVVNMLTNGASAARISANTFAAPGQILSQLDGWFDKTSDKLDKWVASLDENKLQQVLTKEEQQQLIDMLPEGMRESASKVSNIEAWLAKNYDNIPKSVKNAMESLLPSEVKSTISVVHDAMQGKISMDTVGTAAELISGDPITGNVIQSAFEATFNERLKDNAQLLEYVDNKSAQAVEAFKNGNYLAGATYASEALSAQFQNDAGKFGYAFGDTVTNAFGRYLQNKSAVPKSVSNIVDVIPGDIGDTLQKGVEFVENAQNDLGSWFRKLL